MELRCNPNIVIKSGIVLYSQQTILAKFRTNRALKFCEYSMQCYFRALHEKTTICYSAPRRLVTIWLLFEVANYRFSTREKIVMCCVMAHYTTQFARNFVEKLHKKFCGAFSKATIFLFVTSLL